MNPSLEFPGQPTLRPDSEPGRRRDGPAHLGARVWRLSRCTLRARPPRLSYVRMYTQYPWAGRHHARSRSCQPAPSGSCCVSQPHSKGRIAEGCRPAKRRIFQTTGSPYFVTPHSTSQRLRVRLSSTSDDGPQSDNLALIVRRDWCKPPWPWPPPTSYYTHTSALAMGLDPLLPPAPTRKLPVDGDPA